MKPNKNSAGNRIYRQNDIDNLLEIKKLLQDRNYLDEILLDGSKKADKIASQKMKKIHEIIGF